MGALVVGAPPALIRLVSLALVLLVSALAVPASAASAPATEPGAARSESEPNDRTVLGAGRPLLIVLDLSSSMSEQDATGRIRLDGAKVAINRLLRAQPVGAILGLWTYPGPSDACSAGISQGPVVGALNPVRLSATVNGLATAGDTPTGTALRAAVDGLQAAGYDEGTVVLVSDGESNCGEPPCDVAATIVAEGFDVTVEAKGFQTSAGGRQELECIASATGGSYTDVEDSEALSDELAENARPALELSVAGLDRTVAAGTRVSITATVTNVSKLDAKDVGLSVTFLDAGADTLFPTVLAPRQRLGNVPAGETVIREWAFTAGAPGQAGTVRARIGVNGLALQPVATAGTIRISDTVLTIEDAGPLLRDAAARGNLAIVGDSYSAGEGAKEYYPETERANNRCHRSPRTYAMQLFKAAEGAVMACSGAVIADYYAPKAGQDGELGQQYSLRDMDPLPDVVLLTFGGNDAKFADIITKCVLPGDCTDGALASPDNVDGLLWCESGDNPVPDGGSAQYREILCDRTGDSYPKEVFTRIASIERQLTSLYRHIYLEVNAADNVDRRVGKAPVIVLGYPQAFPLNNSAQCDQMSLQEFRFGNLIATKLNAVTARAVAAANAQSDVEGIHFASDVADAVVPDHTACSSEPYINPFVTATALAGLKGPLTARKQELLHPNIDGYQAMTSALVQWSQRVGTPDEAENAGPEGESGDEAAIGGSTYVLEADDWGTGDPTGTIAVDAPMGTAPGEVTTGKRIRITATGFAPGTTVTVTIYSTARTLGAITSDSRGNLDAIVSVPPDLARGPHVLEAWGTGADGEDRRYVRAVNAVGEVPLRMDLLAIGSAVVVLAGAAGLVVLMRRSARVPETSP